MSTFKNKHDSKNAIKPDKTDTMSKNSETLKIISDAESSLNMKNDNYSLNKIAKTSEFNDEDNINFKKNHNFTCSTSIKKSKDKYVSVDDYDNFNSFVELAKQIKIIEHNLQENSEFIREPMFRLENTQKAQTHESNYESLVQNESHAQIMNDRSVVSATKRSSNPLSSKKSSSLERKLTLKDISNSSNQNLSDAFCDECPSFRNLNGTNNQNQNLDSQPILNHNNDNVKQFRFTINSAYENTENVLNQAKRIEFDDLKLNKKEVNNSQKSFHHENLNSSNEFKVINPFTEDSLMNIYTEKDAKENIHELAKEIKSFENKFGKMNLHLDLNLINKMLNTSNDKQNLSVTEFDKDQVSRLIQTLTNHSENITLTDRFKFEMSKEYECFTQENQTKSNPINEVIQYEQEALYEKQDQSLHFGSAPMKFAQYIPFNRSDKDSSSFQYPISNYDQSTHSEYIPDYSNTLQPKLESHLSGMNYQISEHSYNQEYNYINLNKQNKSLSPNVSPLRVQEEKYLDENIVGNSYHTVFFNEKREINKNHVYTKNSTSYSTSTHNKNSLDRGLANFPLNYKALITPVNPFHSNNNLKQVDINLGASEAHQLNLNLTVSHLHQNSQTMDEKNDNWNEFTYPPINIKVNFLYSYNIIIDESRYYQTLQIKNMQNIQSQKAESPN